MARSTKRRTHASSESQTPEPPGALTVGSTREPPLDVALELFLRKPPSAADHLIVSLQGFGPDSDQIVIDLTRAEAQEVGPDLANQITMAARSLAANERKECRFRAQWCVSDRVLGSYGWRAGDAAQDAVHLDGTLQSLLAQNQRHLETAMRINAEGDTRTQRTLDSQQRIITMLEKRNAALEARINELAEELAQRRNGSEELAATELAAHLESKARTQEILLQRGLPLLEMVIARSMSPEAAAANGGNRVVSDLVDALGGREVVAQLIQQRAAISGNANGIKDAPAA